MGRVFAHIVFVIVAAHLFASVGCASTPPTPLPPREAPPPVGAKNQVNPATGQGSSEFIPLVEREGYLYVRTAIEGQDAGWFMIDTGASLNLVSTGVASRLGRVAETQRSVSGIGGFNTMGYESKVELSIGNDDYPLAAGPLGSIGFAKLNNSIGVPMSGIIGFPALINTKIITFDYARDQLVFPSPRALTERPLNYLEAVPYQIINGLPYIQATVRGINRRHSVLLLIDTGADQTMMLPNELLQLDPSVRSVPQSGTQFARGVGGTVESVQGWVGSIQMFRKRFTDLPVSWEPAPPGKSFRQTRRFMGRIGNDFLSKYNLTFDPKRQVVWLMSQE